MDKGSATISPETAAALPTHRAPERTCVACRRKGDQESFFRISRSHSGNLEVKKGVGRSAYFCRTPACIDVALEKGRLGRAFRCQIGETERAALRKVLYGN